MVLKIYLIEDTKIRRNAIIKYFKGINELLKGNALAINTEVQKEFKFFGEKGYNDIEIIPILPDNGQDKYSDYVFDEAEDWVQRIENILARQEKRIFLIDLALNKDERACFGSDEDAFRAKTAKKIMNHISSKANTKEYLIYESVLGHLVSCGYSALDMEKNEKKTNIAVWFMRGNYFNIGQDEYERAHGIAVTFQKVLEEM